MPEERTIHLRFADNVERQRYATLREQPGMHDVMSMGANLARDYLLPRIADGRAMYQAGELDRQISGFLKAGRSDLAKQLGRRLTDDEEFMLRIGYDSTALAAKEAHVQEQAEKAAELLGESYALAMASIDRSNQALALIGQAPPPSTPAMTASHALALGTRRPLRPEDFGALPVSGAGPAPRPGFDAMATRTAASLSAGVGPTHRSGEPPSDQPPAR